MNNRAPGGVIAAIGDAVAAAITTALRCRRPLAGCRHHWHVEQAPNGWTIAAWRCCHCPGTYYARPPTSAARTCRRLTR
jgi:hypothetical protein